MQTARLSLALVRVAPAKRWLRWNRIITAVDRYTVQAIDYARNKVMVRGYRNILGKLPLRS